MFINRWTDRQIMICIHDGIIFSHKVEWSANKYYNMDGPWDKPDTKAHILNDYIYVYEIPRTGKFVETENDWWLPVAEGKENEEKLFSGHRVSSWVDGNVLKVDRGGACTTLWMWMWLMPLNCPL